MSSYNIKPVEGSILIRVNKEAEETTKGGLIIAKQGERWQDDVLLAEIMAIGDNEKNFAVGEVVLIRGYDGKWLDPIFFDDANLYLYRVVETNVVLAKVSKALLEEAHGNG